ncbi:MAG TPA: tol-pal system-associated acyl-CoA thioesterase [Burkholderiales bacterium]|nr:tol-pal system-associated acyl-CoA thioesterase [Burkholderiales bacterium]
MESREAEPFLWPVRVYYEDTDAGGLVYYANYLKYMERARTEWLRGVGFEQTDLAHCHGVIFVVRSAAIEYLAPARFNDELQVTVELIKVGAGQIDLVQRVSRGDTLLVQAAVKLACVARATMRATRIPQPLATRIRMKKS